MLREALPRTTIHPSDTFQLVHRNVSALPTEEGSQKRFLEKTILQKDSCGGTAEQHGLAQTL